MSTTLPNFPLWFYIPAALLAALGLFGLYCSLFKSRAKGRLRCPKCWYDMAGTTPPATCPECGRTAATTADLQRTRRHWWYALAALLLIAPLTVVFARLHAAKAYYAVMPKWKLVQEERHITVAVRRYKVRNPDEWGERLVVKDGSKTVIDHEDQTIDIGERRRPYFADYNDDGVKEAVVECYSGGAHCCYRVYIIEARPSGAVIVADIDARNGMSTPSLKSGREWLLDIPDQSFDYWKVSHAESPMPSVFYRLQDGALRIAIDYMEVPAWSPAELDAKVKFILSDPIPKPDQSGLGRSLLWRTMLDRIYAGYEHEAWQVFERACTLPAPERAAFRREFLAILSADPWHQDLIAAQAARTAGKPIPPSIVAMSGRAGAAEVR